MIFQRHVSNPLRLEGDDVLFRVVFGYDHGF